jgi:hypothetical protein
MVGRHNHRGPFCEGRGLTHALTDTAPTDLTVAYASRAVGAQPHSDRILRVLCGRLAPGAHFMPLLDALKRACRRSSLQARARSLEVRYRGAAGGAEKAHSRQRCWCLWSKPVNLGTWGLVPDPIAKGLWSHRAMARAFGLQSRVLYGTVVHTRENGFR